MNQRRDYREHRIPTSLASKVGKSLLTESELRALAAKAHSQGVIVFLKPDLARIPDWARAVIESEARRIYGPA